MQADKPQHHCPLSPLFFNCGRLLGQSDDGILLAIGFGGREFSRWIADQPLDFRGHT